MADEQVNLPTPKLVEIVCEALTNLGEANGSSLKQIVSYITSNGPQLMKKQIVLGLKYGIQDASLIRVSRGKYKIADKEDRCRCTRMWTPKKMSRRRKIRRRQRSLCKSRSRRRHRSRSKRRSRCNKRRSRTQKRRSRSRRRKRRSTKRRKRCGGNRRRRRSRSRRRSRKMRCRTKSSRRRRRRPRRRVKRCSTCTKIWTPKMMGKRRKGRGKKCEEKPQNNEESQNGTTNT